MNKRFFTIPNILSLSRAIIGIIILLIPVFSPLFYAIYSIGGISDMIDGTIARKTKTSSILGEKIDSVADFIFLLCCFIKIFPKINISVIQWMFIILVLIIKIVNFIFGIYKYKKIFAVHSILNKATGFFLFIYPFFINNNPYTYFLIALSLISAVSEIFLICK